MLQKLERHFMSYIITYYLPSGLFVVVSWISFLIPPDIVPGKLLSIYSVLETYHLPPYPYIYYVPMNNIMHRAYLECTL